MATYTRIYPVGWDNNVNVPPWYFPTTFKGGWDTNPQGGVGFASLVGYIAGTQYSFSTWDEHDPANPFRVGLYRWTSYKLNAQTIQGTFDMVMAVQEENAAANFSTKIYMYVTVGESDAVRGVLLDFEDTDEWPTTAQGIALSATQTLTPVAVTAGDRLVIEFGFIARNAVITSYDGSTWAGASFGSTDLTVGSTNVTTERGHFDFSVPINFDEPEPADGAVVSSNEELYIYSSDGELQRIIVEVGANGGTPDPSNGLQLSDGTWVFPTEETDSQLIFFDENFHVTNIVDADGTRARSLTRDAQDNIFVGFRGNTNLNPTAPTYYPRKFSSNGTLLASYAVAIGTAGPSSVDLKSDQRTLVYVCRDRTIRAYDIVADVQLPDIATLPTETGPDYNVAARAYGIRCLIDGGYLVADLIDIKRLDSAGNIIRRYTEPNVEDWQSVTVGVGWSTFVSATIGAPDSSAIQNPGNPNVQGATGPGTPLAVKWNMATGDKMFELLQDIDPDTGGSQRGFSTVGGPTAGGLPIPEDVGMPEDYPVRYLRRSPIISDQEARIFHERAQFVFQAGIGTTSGQGADPQCLMRFSDDGGHTWSSEARRAIGEKGVYNARVTYFKLGQCRNRVYEVVVSDPAIPVVLIDLVLDLTKGEN